MSKLLFNTKYEFLLLKRRMSIIQITGSLLSQGGLEMINSLGEGGGMAVASMYPASRKVVKPIKCEYTSILVDYSPKYWYIHK